MNRRWRRSPALVAAVVAATSMTTGLTALLTPARATSTFTLSRLAGSDRYQTASVIDQAAFPAGESTALLADGVASHQSDALSASGAEGVFSVGVLLTDNTGTVPSPTLSALSANKVKKIVVVGGTGAVSQSQISQLQSQGYQVSTPYQGATRWQTMKLVDESMGGAGSDGAGNATGILASGEDAHLVDALAAGGLAYAKHFPIILTNSTGPGLQPEAQQVISDMGIKHLIVVGGSASVPTAEYTPNPSGVTKVDVEAGKDRSETSKVLADFAITAKWLTGTNLTLARGDDGADALAGAAFAGVRGFPTVVTNSPGDSGSAPAFATEHAGTLAGPSYIFGGTSAVPDSQKSAIETAGQGQSAGTAPAGTFGTAGGSSPLVTAEDANSFTQGNLTYTYKSGDTYQIVTTSSNPGSSPACGADQGGYQDFQARLSTGDSISGNYQPTGTSTFCLNDIAPHPPSSVSAAPATSGGGVTVTWQVPSTAGTDNVSGYTVWRAPAATSQVPSAPSTCPAAYTVSPGVSPQTPPPPPPPSSNYSPLATNIQVQGAASSGTYSDTSATPGTAYCYAVSSESPNAAGTKQTGTAAPANPSSNPLQAGQPGPVTAALPSSGGAPLSLSTAFTDAGTGRVGPGDTFTVTFNQPVSVNTGPQGAYSVVIGDPCPTAATDTCPDTQVTLNGADSTVSTASGGTNVTFTETGPPEVTQPGTSGLPTLKDLEVISASGIANGAGQVWNVPGSGVTFGPLSPSQTGTNLDRVFAGGNPDLPQPPTIYNVYTDSTSNPSEVTFQCTSPSSNVLNVYDQNGKQLGTAACAKKNGSFVPTTATPSPSSGAPSPFTFTAGQTYIFNEQDTSMGSGQQSQGRSVVATSPVTPQMSSVAVGGTGISEVLTVTYNEPILCSSVDTDGSDYAVTSTPPGTFGASCSGTTSSTVTLTPKVPAAFTSGTSITVTAKSGTDTDTACTTAPLNDNVCEAVGDHQTTTAP